MQEGHFLAMQQPAATRSAAQAVLVPGEKHGGFAYRLLCYITACQGYAEQIGVCEQKPQVRLTCFKGPLVHLQQLLSRGLLTG